MRITILFLLVSLLTCGAGFGYSQGKEIEEQQDPYFWDFGQVSQGEVLEHVFVLKNDYRVILHIKNIRTSCGCTTSEVEKKGLKILSSMSFEIP